MLIKYSGIKELEGDPFAEKARMTSESCYTCWATTNNHVHYYMKNHSNLYIHHSFQKLNKIFWILMLVLKIKYIVIVCCSRMYQ